MVRKQFITPRTCAPSSIRIRKFCASTTVNASKLDQTGFARPFTLEQGLTRMITSEFLVPAPKGPLFDSAGG